MRIKITREKLISLLILLPYVDSLSLQKYLQIYFKETFIRAISIISIIITMIFCFLILKKRIRIMQFSHRTLMFTFILYSLFQVLLFSKTFLNSFSVWVWISMPMLFALVVGSYCEQRKLDYNIIIKHTIQYFCLYTMIAIVYYMVRHNLFFDSTVRLGPRGGGAVIFGYTIAVVFAFNLQYKHLFDTTEYYVLQIVLSIGALGTGSRAAVWPIAFLWIINFLFSKITLKKVIISFLLVPVCIILSTTDIAGVIGNIKSASGVGRLFEFSSTSRFLTLTNSLMRFSASPLFAKIFGFGLNGFYPYQKWLMHSNDFTNNMFTQNGVSFLVQPHNSFIYCLMESGLIGLFIILGIIVYSGWSFLHYKNRNYASKIVFLGVIVFVNCFDAVFYVQPAVAGTFWLLIIITVNENKKVYINCNK